jgi:hypothetical protein
MQARDELATTIARRAGALVVDVTGAGQPCSVTTEGVTEGGCNALCGAP